jgi:hypothetical protein
VDPRAGLVDVQKRIYLNLAELKLLPLSCSASRYKNYASPASWMSVCKSKKVKISLLQAVEAHRVARD